MPSIAATIQVGAVQESNAVGIVMGRHVRLYCSRIASALNLIARAGGGA